jgi:hypothetical protein
MDSGRLQERILRALRSGPLYRPTLQLVVGCSERQAQTALCQLISAGTVERAADVGPASYRLTATN